MDFASATLLSITLLAMGVCLAAMIFVPVLPGQFGIWLAAVLYGLAVGWETLGWPVFIILTLITLLAMVVDQIAGWWGAKRGGASWKGVVTGWLVGLVGLLFFNAIGAIAGFLLGLIGYEYYQTREWEKAWRAAKGYLLGQLLSLVVRLALAVWMIGIFWIQVT